MEAFIIGFYTGGESPSEAFKRVYEEQMGRGGEVVSDVGFMGAETSNLSRVEIRRYRITCSSTVIQTNVNNSKEKMQYTTM